MAPEAPTVGEFGLEQDRPGRAGDARGHVHHQEAAGAERLLHGDPEHVQDEHVHAEVNQVRVEEHGGQHAPPLPAGEALVGQEDVADEKGALVVQRALRVVEADTPNHGDDVHEDVERDQCHRRRRRLRGEAAARRAHRPSRAVRRRAHARVIRTADPDRREGHAVLADGATALRARHERLAVRVAVAMRYVAHRRLA